MSRLSNLLTLSIRNSRCVYNLFQPKQPAIFWTTHCSSSISRMCFSHSQLLHLQPNKPPAVKNKKAKSGPSIIDESDWHTVYIFPYIVPVRIFSRSKLYLTIITSLGVPYSAILYTNDMIAIKEMWPFFAVSGFSTFALYAFGHLFRRCIGSVYISPDEKLVRISHLTFFGNRQETVLPLGDIAPLCDSNQNLQDIFLRVSSADPKLDTLKDSLFISLRFGGILDSEKFMKIFGMF